jgi:hypothetical protein
VVRVCYGMPHFFPYASWIPYRPAYGLSLWCIHARVSFCSRLDLKLFFEVMSGRVRSQNSKTGSQRAAAAVAKGKATKGHGSNTAAPTVAVPTTGGKGRREQVCFRGFCVVQLILVC